MKTHLHVAGVSLANVYQLGPGSTVCTCSGVQQSFAFHNVLSGNFVSAIGSLTCNRSTAYKSHL